MIDNVNPTNQFHPYNPPDATPAADKARSSGLGGLLGRWGIDTGSLRNLNMAKARDAARNNPAMVLGGLAALAIGAGLMRKRRLV